MAEDMTQNGNEKMERQIVSAKYDWHTQAMGLDGKKLVLSVEQVEFTFRCQVLL